MRIVLDTNVLVSGLLSTYGPPGVIVRLVAAGSLNLCYDGRILNEYREVLARPRFGFRREDIEALIAAVEIEGLRVAPLPLGRPLPDPDDEPFLEAAIAGRAEALVIGNIRHYPRAARQGARIMTPAAFLDHLRRLEGA